MKTIVIPGYSHKNKDWAEETAKYITDSIVYEWKHWSDPTLKFSAKNEAVNLQKLVGDEPVNIIAKSIGTLVSVISVKQIKEKINKIIFCGIPVEDISEDEKWEYKILSDFDPMKIVVYQNSEDFHGSFETVRKFLSQINPNIKIIEKPGSTHDYPFYEEFKEFLNS